MRLITFGRPYVALVGGEGEEVALQPLSVAVLTYLAVGGPRDRDHLADLFWHGNKNGLNSLSTTLNRIRAQVPDGLWVRGNTLVGADLATDLGDLRKAIDSSDFEAVSELYVAPFLGSLKLRRSSREFEEWVLEERATLASMVELTLLQRGRDLFESGEYQAAAATAEQAWEVAIRDGFPSPDYFDAYHRILASAARPSANTVRSMADDFGIVLPLVEPVASDPDEESLLASAPARRPSAEANLVPISAATQLFGCKDELRAIETSVASHDLTTVVGLGGAGKTRLAAEFFNSSLAEQTYPNRYWVNLRDVADPVLLGPAIAAALDQRFEDVESLAEWFPEDEPVLLVLDNFEHVLEAAEVATDLANANHALRVLVTSRVPLGVAEESLVQLSGLDTSDAELGSAAEQLFVSAARRAGATSDRLSGQSLVAIRDVCRRVGGNPLALEIAGGWAHILSPAEMIEALSADNELLGTPLGREVRSMDAVLEYSWATLSETEQNTLMLLATFPAGCLTKEALKLPGLSIRSIGKLVQHSLVRLHIEGRITLHPLIASHALAQLAQRPDLKRELQQILSDWCQSFAKQIQANETTTQTQTWAAEIANFTSAWRWDARHGLWDLHQATVGPVREFFTDSGRLSEGLALLGMVADAVRSDPLGPAQLLAALLEALGGLHIISGDLSQAQTQLDEALALNPSDDLLGRGQILRTLGSLKLNSGETDEATEYLQAGLALIADVEEPGTLTAALQLDLAQVYHYRGDQEEAEKTARLALHAGREAEDQLVITVSYLLLAAIAVETDPHRAIVLLNEGKVIAKKASLDNSAIYFPFFSGLARLKLNEVEQAENDFTEGLQVANEIGQLPMMCANSIGRAEARLLREATADAVDDLKTGIRLAIRTSNGRFLMWAAVMSCRAACVSHAPNSDVRELLLLALHHPTADPDARDKAIESLRLLFGETEVPASVAVANEDAVSLDEVAERALQLLPTALTPERQ